jgi:hypothetical protein
MSRARTSTSITLLTTAVFLFASCAGTSFTGSAGAAKGGADDDKNASADAGHNPDGSPTNDGSGDPTGGPGSDTIASGGGVGGSGTGGSGAGGNGVNGSGGAGGSGAGGSGGGNGGAGGTLGSGGGSGSAAPLECTSANVKFAAAPGKECPANYAAYTADDARSPMFGCCPLPANDILDAAAATPRAGKCAADEVVTGVGAGGNQVLCRKINTTKYKLATTQTTCYAGHGAAGGDGAGECGTPPATFQALTAVFGIDACIGAPFGSLIVARTGSACGDVKSAQLLDLATGQAITMYK